MLDELKDSPLLSELVSLHNTGVDLVDPSDLSGVVKGRKNLYSHLQDRINDAKKEVILLTTEQGLSRKSQALKNAFRKASERGVSIKVAAPLTAQSRTDALSISKFCDIRHSDLKGRFMIVDAKEVTFMLLDDEKTHPNYDFGVWIRSDMFAKTMASMFTEGWKDLKALK